MALAGIINKIWHLRDNLVLPKASGKGILTDPDAPTYGWRDLEGQYAFDAAGADAPVLKDYDEAGGVQENALTTTAKKIDCRFHVPHDYAPGTDIYFHVHWSHNGTGITGDIVFTADMKYAKGHNQANFSAAKAATTPTYATTNLATTPRLRHRIEEVAITAGSADSSHFLNTDMEVDGLFLIKVRATTLPTVTSGDVFVHCIDMHYQSTSVGTKQKAPNFYT